MRPLLCSLPFALLFAQTAHAQCQLADKKSYDFCVPANPLTLETAFPFEYPVVGTHIKFVSPDAPPGHLKMLFASGSAAIHPLGPPAVGCLLLSNPVPVSPFQTVAEWTYPVPFEPWDAAPDAFVQCLSTDGAEVRLSNALELYLGAYAAEIEVLSVTTTGTPVSGKSHPFSVTFRNNGNAPATPLIQVCVGGVCGSAPFAIDPGETLTGTVFVTPFAGFSCGGGFSQTLGACSLLPDCDASNNCVLTSTFVDSAYWDLHFEIINEPSSVHVGQTASWTVKVTNTGNIPSDNVCFINGINLSAGPGLWSQLVCGLFQEKWTGVIQPGQSQPIPVSQFICSGAFTVPQWIKTEIHYSAGCFDNCGAGNFDQESIQILP